MQDAQHLERVRLEFQMFEIQKGEHKDKDKEWELFLPPKDIESVLQCKTISRTNCTDGYLKIFLKGQETQDAYDKFDYELCGYDLPAAVVSDGPRLAMVFSSGELQARGFKVNKLISEFRQWVFLYFAIYLFRPNTHSKPNTKYQEPLLLTAHVRSRTAVRHERKVNLTVQDIHRITHPKRIVRTCSWQHRTNKWPSFSIISK